MAQQVVPQLTTTRFRFSFRTKLKLLCDFPLYFLHEQDSSCQFFFSSYLEISTRKRGVFLGGYPSGLNSRTELTLFSKNESAYGYYRPVKLTPVCCQDIPLLHSVSYPQLSRHKKQVASMNPDISSRNTSLVPYSLFHSYTIPENVCGLLAPCIKRAGL